MNALRGLSVAGGVVLRSVSRLFAPEVSLAVGGICYYGLLALAPLFMIIAVMYGLIFSPEAATRHLAVLASAAPAPAQAFVADQLARMTAASPRTLSFQGALAVLVALYAASRGTKAVVLGLTVMRGETHAWSFWGYNALGVAFAAAMVASAALAGFSAAAGPMGGRDITGVSWIVEFFVAHRWLVSGVAFATLSMALYRYVMAAGRVPWRWSGLGGACAGALWASGSAGFARFNTASVELGEIYGSVSAVVAFLLWLYLTATAVLWGGALASEAEWASAPQRADADRAVDDATQQGVGSN